MSILKACIIAFGTYSKFPVPYFEWKEKDMKYSICFFPFVGVLLGAAEWLWFWICVNYGMGSLFKAAGAVIINILVTGGIHIDGYMDTMDALHSYQPVEKKLEILKDAHIGAFAVIMLSVLLLAYIGALPGIDFNNVPLFASTFVLLFICAIILTYTNISESIIPTVIIVITIISILLGSSISTIKIKKNGIVNGGIIGLTYILMLYFISSIVHTGFSLNIYSIVMIILSILAGMVGGIVGVNRTK